MFTVPFALFGHYEMWLWMVTCVAITLGGSVAAGRIAYRLTVTAPPRENPGRWDSDRRVRYAGIVAGVFGAVALVGIQDWWHYALSSQSDTMIAALCLGAIDCHLSGRPRWAFALGVLASLGRPGGVAVSRAVLDLGVARDPLDEVGDRRRDRRAATALVRESRRSLLGARSCRRPTRSARVDA